MAAVAPSIHSMTTDDVRNVSVDMSALLDAGELLTGTPAIQCSADLTIANPQINSAAVDINGSSVAAGAAVQFTAQSAVPGRYRIEVLCDTDAGQVIEGIVVISVERSRY